MEMPLRRTDVDAALLDGLQAYAAEHAATELAFREMLQVKWAGILDRAHKVLAELAEPSFPEKSSDRPVEVDLGEEEDPEDGSWEVAPENEQDEVELIA